MKSIINIGGSSFLVFAAVFCTFGALFTSFSILVNPWILLLVWLIYAVVASVCVTYFRSKGILALFALAVLITYWQWEQFSLGFQWVVHTISYNYNIWLLTQIFFAEVVEYAEYTGYPIDSSIFLLITGLAVINALAVAICMRRSTPLTILFTAPIIFLTLVIAHIPPNTFYIFGILAVYITVFLSSSFNPDDFMKRGLAFIPALALTLSFLGLTYLIAAPSRHVREGVTHAVSGQVRNIAAQVGWWWGVPIGFGFELGWPMMPGGIGGGVWQFNTANVNIADAGTRQLFGIDLLEVISSEPGTFYLRGYSMSYFDGRAWHRDMPLTYEGVMPVIIPEHLEEKAMSMPALIAYAYKGIDDLNILDAPPISANMVIRRTGDFTNIVYRPYYGLFADETDGLFLQFQDSVHVVNEEIRSMLSLFRRDSGVVYIYNNDRSEWFRVFDYGAGRVVVPDVVIDHIDSIRSHFEIPSPIDTFIHIGDTGLSLGVEGIFFGDILSEYTELLRETGRYTSIDPDTSAELRYIALRAGIDPNADRAVVADAVARYVRQSASYSMEVEAAPYYEDFALYFLQNAQVGYCIHFATAATMMLRALDIPARFVTGYVATIHPSEVYLPVTITDANAHAWVEVFYEDVGWLYLEATPSTGENIVPAISPHSHHNPMDELMPYELFGTGFDSMTQNGMPFHMNGDYMNGFVPREAQGDTPETRSLSFRHFVITALVLIFLTVITLVVRSIVMRKIRKKRFNDTKTNVAIIYAWRYIAKFRRNHIIISDDIEHLALKAKFSPHRSTEEERRTVVAYATRVAREVFEGKDDGGKLWMKYVSAMV